MAKATNRGGRCPGLAGAECVGALELCGQPPLEPWLQYPAKAGAWHQPCQMAPAGSARDACVRITRYARVSGGAWQLGDILISESDCFRQPHDTRRPATQDDRDGAAE